MSSYLQRDFDTMQAEIMQRVKTKYGDVYDDFSASGQGMMLMDIIAYAAEVVAFYVDRRAKESFMSLAEEPWNVAMLARQNGYRARAAVAASGIARVGPSQEYDFEFSIPVGYAFKNGTGKVFETTEQITYDAGTTTSQLINVREGRSYLIVRSSTGLEDQEIGITGIPKGYYLCNGSVRVIVDGVEWEEVSHLSFDALEQYEVLYLDNPPKIRFGNGISGAIPTSGSEIRVIYVLCSGRDGNVSGISSAVTPLTYGNTTIDLSISQEGTASGGDYPETIDEIRAKAPGYIAAREVAITQRDYYGLASAYTHSQYGAVAVAQAYCARTITGDIETNNYVSDMQGLFDTYLAANGTDSETISGNMTDITTCTTDIASKCSLILGCTDTIQTNIDTIVTKARSVLGRSDILVSPQGHFDLYLQEESDSIVTLPELIALMEASSDAAIVAIAPDIEDMKNTFSIASGTVENAITALDALGNSIITCCDEITTQRGTIDAYVATVQTDNSTIITEANATKSITDGHAATYIVYQTEFETAYQALVEHLNDVISADGMSNMITVPILAIDSGGYYTAPSTGLMRGLETYLEERSDVAHMVRVVSGARTMVGVDLQIGVRVIVGYVFSEVTTQIDNLVRSELKRRKFGISLYVSRIHQIIQSVIGVDVFNVTFASERELDSYGNLLITAESVIVPGDIVISPME